MKQFQINIGNCAACCWLFLKLKNLNETSIKRYGGDQGIRVKSLQDFFFVIQSFLLFLVVMSARMEKMEASDWSVTS